MGWLLAAVNDTSTLCQKHRVVLYVETDKLIVPYTSCQHLVKTSYRIVREDRRADRKKHMKSVFSADSSAVEVSVLGFIDCCSLKKPPEAPMHLCSAVRGRAVEQCTEVRVEPFSSR